MSRLAPETVIAGKYVVKRPLESGGMGDVYEAWQIDLARTVALKTLPGDLSDDPSSVARFQREAEASAAIGHPNIVHLLDFCAAPGEPPVIVMERLEGRSLRALMGGAPIAPHRAVFISLQILSALEAAHAARILHRDIKPGNVFVLETLAIRDFVKVLDFGLAKVIDEPAALTRIGEVIGTAAYMAPEQARGERVDERTDLFSVGAVLFEALSGQKPRDLAGGGAIAARSTVCSNLVQLAPGIDERLAAIVDRALSFSPADRFSSATEMGLALAPFSRRPVAFAPIDVTKTTAPEDLAATTPGMTSTIPTNGRER